MPKLNADYDNKIYFRIEETTKVAFYDYCKVVNEVPSKVIRELIRKRLSEYKASNEKPVQSKAKPVKKPVKKRNLFNGIKKLPIA